MADQGTKAPEAETPTPVPVADTTDAKPSIVGAAVKSAIAAVKAVATPQPETKPATPAPKPATKKPAVVATVKAAPTKASPAKRKPAATPTSAAPIRTAPQVTPTLTLTPTPTPTPTLNKDTTMTDTNQIFSKLNDSTKGAVEKGTQMFDEMNAFGKGNIEAIVESSKIAAKNLETLGQDAAARAKTQFEGLTEAAKTLASAKSPTEFLKLHADYTRTAFDTLIAESARSTEQFLKMMGEVSQPISNRVAVATEKMKISA